MSSPLINTTAHRRPLIDSASSPAPARRILLVQTSYLGDTILSTPLIAALHQLHPGSELWMMTTPAAADLVRSDPLVHRVIVFDKRVRDRGLAGLLRMSRQLRTLDFERSYALQRSYRTALMLGLSGIRHRTGFRKAKWSFLYHTRQPRDPDQHDVHRNLALLAGEAPVGTFTTDLRLFPPSIDRIDPDLAVHLRHAVPYIILVPGSAWETKRWHWQHFRTVAERLLDHGRRVILIGGAEDRAINRRVARGRPIIDLTARTSVAEAMTIVQHAGGIVCNDSMALHLASAFHKPCVAVFCATSPAFGFGPWQNPNAVVVEVDGLPCRPCARHGGRHCPTGTSDCMTAPPPETVLDALQSVMDLS